MIRDNLETSEGMGINLRSSNLNPSSDTKLKLQVKREEYPDSKKKSNTGVIKMKSIEKLGECLGKSSKFKRTNSYKAESKTSLKDMTENRFSYSRTNLIGIHVYNKDSLNSSTDNDDEEELNIPCRNIRIRTNSIKKLSKLVKLSINNDLSFTCENRLSDSNEGDEKVELDKHHGSTFLVNKIDSFKLKEGEHREDQNTFEFHTESEGSKSRRMSSCEELVQVIENEEEFNPLKFHLSQDEVLQKLISEYYYDIKENIIGNFEAYIVNNLTIICFLQDIIPKSNNMPTLSSSQIEKLLEFDRSKKILLLDLDETLIHSDLEGCYSQCDAEVEIYYEEEESTIIKFNIRPYLKEFLEFASENFNIILFTAGIQSYADPIIEFLDPHNKYFNLRVYRESCLEYCKFFIKDLNIFTTFGTKDMILVDNCIFSFAKNLRNGILVTSFYDNKDDSELLDVMTYLEERLINVKDVREINENVYGLEAIKSCLRQKLVSEGILMNIE